MLKTAVFQLVKPGTEIGNAVNACADQP